MEQPGFFILARFLPPRVLATQAQVAAGELGQGLAFSVAIGRHELHSAPNTTHRVKAGHKGAGGSASTNWGQPTPPELGLQGASQGNVAARQRDRHPRHAALPGRHAVLTRTRFLRLQ